MTYVPSRAADSRLRRLASQLGYALRRSRSTLGVNNHGGWRIVDPHINAIVVGENFDLDDVEVDEWLVSRSPTLLAPFRRR